MAPPALGVTPNLPESVAVAIQVQVQVVYSRLRENSDKTKLSYSKQVCVFSYVDFVSASQKFLNMYMHIYESIACMCMYVCNISIASMCSGNSIYVHIDLCTHICVRHIYRTLQHIASHCNTLHHTATHCITLQHIASHCITLQHIASHCNTLHHTVIPAQE